MNESAFAIADALIALLGGPGNILTATYTRGAHCVKVTVADPAATRPDELRDHPAIQALSVTSSGFDLDLGPYNCPAFTLSLLASANILPELT
ncbi:hypothetical protein [Streptomyces triculaminicus]|uniref:hypothetical protein n=1 Tax=Streptomyces triculaminicus TaxID=2816232 RepID=UPI0037D894D0